MQIELKLDLLHEVNIGTLEKRLPKLTMHTLHDSQITYQYICNNFDYYSCPV